MVDYETIGGQPHTLPVAGDKVYLERPGSPGTPHHTLWEELVPTEDSDDLPVFAGPLAAADEIVVRHKADTSGGAQPNGTDKKAGAGVLTLRHNKDDATTDPGVGNDSTQGFSAGSRWTNVTGKRVFYLLDPSAGAAHWVTAAGLIDEYRHIHTPVNTLYNADDGTGRAVGIRLREKQTIAEIWWGSGVAHGASDANYHTLNVMKISPTGGNSAGVALCSAPKSTSLTTPNPLTGGTLVKNQLYNLGVNQNLDCNPGDLVYMHITPTGSVSGMTTGAHSLRLLGVPRI